MFLKILIALAVALSLVGCDSVPTETNSGQVFRVADYGAKGDGVTDDSAAIRSAIVAAMQAGVPSTVLFAASRYRVSSEVPDDGKYCFSLQRATGVTLQGVAGRTELISSNPRAGMVSFHSCTNVYVKGITIDYDPVPFIQGDITAVDASHGTFDFVTDEGFPDLAKLPQLTATFEKNIGRWGIAMNRKTKSFKPGTPSFLSIRTFTALGERRWRLELENHASAKMLAVGDAFAMRAGAEGYGVFFWGCNGGSVENVTIYASPSLCLAFVQCEGDLAVRRVDVRPRPGTTRLLSGNADGIHCQRIRTGLLVEGCHFEGMTDDGMNTYDQVRMVTEVISPTELRVHKTFDTRPGDRIQVLDPKTGFVRGEASVTGIAGNRILLDAPIIGVRTSTNLLKGIISMNNHLDADVVFNLSTCGAGYIVRNNYFGNFRGRGLILRAVNGLIENNIFERTSGPGICIANEPQWPEGPMPHDIVIRGNQLLGVGTDAAAAGYGAIEISGHGLKQMSPFPVLKNVRIENNVITDPPARGIMLQSCDGATLTGNRIDADAARTLPSSAGVFIGTCSNVVISGLVINDSRPKTMAGISIAPSVAAGENGVKISGLKANLPPTAKLIFDKRVAPVAEQAKK